jgi:hypothetical protein
LRHPREVRVEQDARMLAAQQRFQSALAGFRSACAVKFFAVEFDQVEGAEDYIRGVLLAHQLSLFSWKRMLAWMALESMATR